MIAGRWAVKGGEIPGLDLQRLIEEHSRLATALQV
jgi:hypothetical protein